MALPKIEFPTYTMTLPSTGKKIHYRPYTVKEEKSILIAKETSDAETLLATVKSMIESCTMNKVSIDNLTSFDFEMLFLKIRGISVGESAKLNILCDACKEYNLLTFDLNKAEINGEIKKPLSVEISDTLGFTVSYPKFSATQYFVSIDNDYDRILNFVAASIESIYEGDTVYDPADSTQAELLDFVESLPSNKIEEVINYYGEVPQVKITKKFVCKHCESKESVELAGIEHFFF
jgi:hypothetical protein